MAGDEILQHQLNKQIWLGSLPDPEPDELVEDNQDLNVDEGSDVLDGDDNQVIDQGDEVDVDDHSQELDENHSDLAF